MPELIASLNSHSRVGLDSSIFIYGFEGATHYAKLARIVFGEISSGTITGVTSTLTLMEITVRPRQLGRQEAAASYDFRVRTLPNLTIVAVGIATAQRAAELRAAHRLQPVDAVQIAACLQHQATAFVTNDRRLRRVTEIEVLILDDFLPAGTPLTTP